MSTELDRLRKVRAKWRKITYYTSLSIISFYMVLWLINPPLSLPLRVIAFLPGLIEMGVFMKEENADGKYTKAAGPNRERWD